MSNFELFELPPLEVESYQVTEVIRCILHTILFNRALGGVRPREVDSELFDITWVTCGDAAVAARVDSEAATIQAWADRNPGKRGEVRLSFYERRQQQGWFVRQEQRLYWEQWRVALTVLPSDTALLELHTLEADTARAAQKQALNAKLEECLTRIVSGVNERRNHIPPVVSDSALTFPFDVAVSTAGASSETSSSALFSPDIFKRMLSTTQPPSVLH